MEKLLLITVDCDLRTGDVAARQGVLDALLAVFAEKGAAGHTTWFLNENDFAITKNHQGFLHEALRRGDAIGIHDHIDFLDGRWEYAPIYDFCLRSRDTVQAWLRAHGYPDALPYHRAGCLFQHPAQYEVLRDLGYTLLSDLYPGDKSPNHTGHLSYDNREVPVGISPYRHDPENFADYKSRRGRFLHVPVAHMYIFLEHRFLGGFIGDTVARWLKASETRGVACAPMAWCFHPYEILTRERTSVSTELVRSLGEKLDELTREFGVEFASLAEVAARFA
ncbi:MAG: hypothetical protein HY321_01040 [Armatimonadetes bacterium]|nr:hypothetical protein [Armatimonadota bacterium]